MSTNSFAPDLAAQLLCERLLVRMFHCLDARDYEGVAACFAEDGLWLRQGKELRGPAQVSKALQERTPTLHVHHLLSNIDVRVDGARARSIAYMTVYRSDTGKAPHLPIPMRGPELVAICNGEFRRAGEDWRVSRLDLTVTYSAAAASR